MYSIMETCSILVSMSFQSHSRGPQSLVLLVWILLGVKVASARLWPRPIYTPQARLYPHDIRSTPGKFGFEQFIPQGAVAWANYKTRFRDEVKLACHTGTRPWIISNWAAFKNTTLCTLVCKVICFEKQPLIFMLLSWFCPSQIHCFTY